jgi:hypothetical protein
MSHGQAGDTAKAAATASKPVVEESAPAKGGTVGPLGSFATSVALTAAADASPAFAAEQACADAQPDDPDRTHVPDVRPAAAPRVGAIVSAMHPLRAAGVGQTKERESGGGGKVSECSPMPFAC